MMPPVLGLKTALPTRLHYRVGACAAAMFATTLALPAVSDVAPAGAEEVPAEDIADRLVPSVAGYVVAPEGTGAGNSRAVSLDDLAAIVGTDLPDRASGSAAGYLRIFVTPAGDGVAMAMGLDLGGDAAAFVGGFREAGAEQASAVTLFPDAASPLGDVVAYQAPDAAGSRQPLIAAFASDSTAVVLVVGGPDDSVAVLRQMAQDQAALTPPTAAAEDGDTTAYTLGRLAFLLVIVGVPAWLIVRAVRHRRRPGPGLPDPTASSGNYPYSASRPGIPLPPLESSSEAPPPPRPSDGGFPPRRPGIPLPPLESSSEAPPPPRPSDGGYPPRRPGIPLPPLEPGPER